MTVLALRDERSWRWRGPALAVVVAALLSASCSSVKKEHVAFFDQIQIGVPHQVTDRQGGGRSGDDGTRFIVELDGELDPQKVLDSITPPNGIVVQRLEWKTDAERKAPDPNGKVVSTAILRNPSGVAGGCTGYIDQRVDGPKNGHTEISIFVGDC
jgi:hypothetical protein